MAKEYQITTNFFWSGDDFQFLNRLTILSHLIVGHKVVVWLSGQVPESDYWIKDIPEVNIQDANDIIGISKYYNLIPRGLGKKRYRIVSSRWRFSFLYNFGGLYCDTDAIAIRKFPNQEWIIASDTDTYYSVGVIKCPPKHPVLKYCIENWVPKWGNVQVFTDAINIHKLGLTNSKKAFYPISCIQHNKCIKSHRRSFLLDNINIPDSYSIHYYGNKTQGMNIDHNTVSQYPNSLLNKLSKRVFKSYSFKN